MYIFEIFPLKLWVKGTSFGMVVNRALSGAITMSLLSLSKAIIDVFFLYDGTTWIFLFSYLPVMKGSRSRRWGCFFRKEDPPTYDAATTPGELQLGAKKDVSIKRVEDESDEEGFNVLFIGVTLYSFFFRWGGQPLHMFMDEWKKEA